MLILQACQQHRLVVMQPNKAKSFPEANVQKCRRWRSRGVLGRLHPTRQNNEGKNPGRKHPELSESEGHLLGKNDGGSGGRGRPNATNTRPSGRGLSWTSSQSACLMFVQQRSMALTVSATLAPRCNPVLQRVVTLLDCRRPKGTELLKLWHLDTALVLSGDCSGVKAEKGNMRLSWR